MKHILILCLDDSAKDIISAADSCGLITVCTDSFEAAEQLIDCSSFKGIVIVSQSENEEMSERCLRLKEKSGLSVISAGFAADWCSGHISQPFTSEKFYDAVNTCFGTGGRGMKGGICFGNVELLPGEKKALKNGNEIALSQKEAELISYMCSHKGEVLSKEKIIADVWGSRADNSTLTVHIRWLREKLEDDPSEPKHIKTVWGVGYILE